MENDKLPKSARLVGQERDQFAERCAQLYVREELTIRDIVDRTGRSYGAIHRALRDQGVRMRPRGSRTHM